VIHPGIPVRQTRQLSSKLLTQHNTSEEVVYSAKVSEENQRTLRGPLEAGKAE